jgi:hypothetical protein
MRTRFDIGEIIRCHGGEFLSKHHVVPAVERAFRHMALCRTSALGGHIEVCPECGDIHISYNSCRDRHCPKCQNKEREEWINCRREEILPVKYFHVVFTLPACLHPVAMAHQSIFYDCMFKAAWATIKAFAEDEGLLTGMTSILHTWGSNLFYHPHIHCIVPGGGIDKRSVWHHLKGCKHSEFLFPVAAMSSKFRGRFMSLLTRRLKEDGILIDQAIRKQCFSKAWVINSKPPAKGVNQVLEYIGRYAYRVAITNSRILDVTDSQISYDYKMYRKGGKHGVMTTEIDSFLNFLSQHILPDRFVRIRHYGFLSPCNREILRSIQQQLSVPPVPKVRKKKSYLDICIEKGWDIGICKDCNCQRIITRIIKPATRAPPFKRWHMVK